MFFQIAVDEGRVHARRRNAIAPNFMFEIVPRHGKGHGDDRALAHGVCKAVGKSGRPGDGCHIQNHAAAVFHGGNAALQTMEHALYVDAKDALEIGGRGGFHVADVRNACVVDENVERVQCIYGAKRFDYLRLIGDIALQAGGFSAGGSDGGCGALSGGGIDVHDENFRPGGGEYTRGGVADSASRASD